MDPISIKFAYITWNYKVTCVGGCPVGYDSECIGGGNKSRIEVLLLRNSAIRGPMTGAEAQAVGACIRSGLMSPADCLATYGGGATAADVIDPNDVQSTKPDASADCSCSRSWRLSQKELDFMGTKINQKTLKDSIKLEISKGSDSPIVFKA